MTGGMVQNVSVAQATGSQFRQRQHSFAGAGRIASPADLDAARRRSARRRLGGDAVQRARRKPLQPPPQDPLALTRTVRVICCDSRVAGEKVWT